MLNFIRKNPVLNPVFLLLIVTILLVSGCAKQNRVDFKTKSTLLSPDQTVANLTEEEKAEALRIPSKQMTFAQACYAKDHYEKNNDKFLTLKCAERILAVGGNQEIVCNTTLELAKLSLDDGNYAKAQKYATQYQKLYPGSPDIFEAGYVNIKAHFLDTLNEQRDQTKTNKTIELAQNFIEENSESIYYSSVKDILESCYQTLIKNELHIAQTYIQKYKYAKTESSLAAAQARIDYAKEKLMPHVLYTEGLILDTEIKLAQAQENQDLIKLKRLELEEKFPQSESKLAQNINKGFFGKIKSYFVT